MIETVQPPTETKAIKDHVCSFCGDKISIGEIYLKSIYVYDNIYDWKAHKHCNKLCTDLKMNDDCDEGVTSEHFSESVRAAFVKIMRIFLPVDWVYNQIIIDQLREVPFKKQLWHVIRHLNKNKP